MRRSAIDCYQHLLQWVTVATIFFTLFCERCWSDVYMESQCGKTVRSRGERIYSQIGLHYQHNSNCSITLTGRYKGQKILLQIEDIDIRGYGDYLEIYTSSKARKPYLMCGEGRRIASRVTSKGDSLRLVFITDGKTNGRGFRAVFTALFPERQCREYGKFRCANRRCISSLLTCDSVNHCGDGSDEKPSACIEQDFKNTARKVGGTDVLIPELIFICIGAILVFFFIYFCVPQFVTHIAYIRRKWAKKKDEKIESVAGSNRPSITSLRPRPSDAFIPIWEVKMSELLDNSGNTLSIIRNASSRGNDDRDKVIADVVSAGKKVHIGRFMVQKSIIEEDVDEYDEVEDDSYQETPVMRVKKTKTDDDESDDEKRLSWIERREAKIKKNLEKETHLKKTNDQRAEDISDGDTIRWEEKQALLKEIVPSRAKIKTPLNKTPFPDWNWGNARKRASSEVLIRPRTSSLPFKPSQQKAAYIPEWDFSDSGESSRTASTETAIIKEVPPSREPQSVVQTAQKPTNGRFTVQKDKTPEMERKLTMSPVSCQEQNSQLQRKISPDKVPTGNCNSNRNNVPSSTNANIGRFAVQKVGTSENREVEKGPSNIIQKTGRFTVEKVKTNTKGYNRNQDSTSEIATKGQLTAQKEGADKTEKSSLRTANTAKVGRFSVINCEQLEPDGIVIEHSKKDQTCFKMPMGRFTVERVTTPEIEQRTCPVKNDSVTNNLPSGTVIDNHVAPKRSGAGRFTVKKIVDQVSSTLWKNPRETFESEDVETNETIRILEDHEPEDNHFSSSSDSDVDYIDGFMETAI